MTDLDLELFPGEILGFLGPNGAGKTTLIKCLLGLITPTAGEIEIFGEDLFRGRARVRQHLGAVVEAPVFHDYLTAMEHLEYLVALTAPVSRTRLQEVLEQVGLGAVAGRRTGTFSYGMKQRLGIAQALLPETRLLVLDEPTNGLDPHGIAGMRNLIRDMAQRLQISVFLSSHLLSEVEQVCDRIVIIHQGRKVCEGTVAELQRRGEDVEIVVAHARPEEVLAGWPGLVQILPGSDETLRTCLFHAGPEAVPGLVRDLVHKGLQIHRVTPREHDLESLFIEKTSGGTPDVRIDSF